MKSLIFWLLIILSLRTESATVEDVIETCLIKILKSYFLKQHILLITDLTVDQQPFRGSLLPNLEKQYHRQMIRKIMNMGMWSLQIYNTDKYIGLPARLKLDRLNSSFVFIRAEIMGSEVLFDWEMDRLHKNPMWKPTGRTLVVVKSESPTNDGADLARRIIEKMWTKSRSVDTLVMVAENSGAVHFYTWFPYRQPDCSRVKRVVHLDTYKKGRFLSKAHLFPEKIQDDLQGCELLAATDSCIPYVFADPNNASKFVDGLEIQVVNALSDMLNFKLLTTRPRNIWTTSVNKTLTGAFKLLVEQKVDLAFSCLMLNRERYLLALALPSYFEDALVWFVPSPTYRSHAVDIFYAFPLDFWLMMMAVVLASAVLVVLFTYVEHTSEGRGPGLAVGFLLKLMGISVYAPVGISTQKPNFRLFIALFTLYSMHITIAFQSSLFALYRQPQYDRFYTSLESAVDDGLFVYLRSSTPDLYNQSEFALWNKILQPGRFDYLQDFGEVFSEIAYDKSAIALFIKTTGIYMISMYFTDDYGTPQILWLKQKFSPYPVTTFLSPGNPLFSLFEKRVHRLLASGLISIWLSRAVLEGKFHLARRGYANSSLTMKHLEGPIFLLLLLLSGATGVFLGELIVFRVFKKLKDRKKPNHRHFILPVKSQALFHLEKVL